MAESPTTARAGADTAPRAVAGAERRPRHPRLVLAGTWFVLAGFLIARQLARDTPFVFADELVFGRLAQNVGTGEGWQFQGNPSPYRTLAPLVMAPAWAAFEHGAAYHAALAINGAVMTSVVLPAFWIARRVASWWPALLAAAGAALTPAMAWAGMLMTEGVAYPACTAALALVLRALLRPGPPATLAAVAAIALAAAVRPQLILLGAVFAGALAALVIGPGVEPRRARAHRHRAALVTLGGLAAAGAALVAASGGTALAGANAGFVETLEDLPPALEWLDAAADHVSVLAVTCLGLPLVALLALSLPGGARRDPAATALLALGWSAVAVFVAFAAYTTVALSPELRERYVFYVTPLLTALWVAMPGRVSPARVAAATTGLALILAPLLPAFGDLATKWVDEDLGDVASFVGLGGGWVAAGRAVSLVAVAVGALGALAAAGLMRLGSRGRAVVLAPPLLFGFAVLNLRESDAAAQSAAFAAERAAPPQRPGWIDGAVDGPVAIVVTEGSDPFTSWHVQITNRAADRVYRLGVPADRGVGEQCLLRAGRDGALAPAGPCGGRALAPYLLFTDGKHPMSLAGGRLLAADARGARLYAAPRGTAPRLDAASLRAVRASERTASPAERG